MPQNNQSTKKKLIVKPVMGVLGYTSVWTQCSVVKCDFGIMMILFSEDNITVTNISYQEYQASRQKNFINSAVSSKSIKKTYDSHLRPQCVLPFSMNAKAILFLWVMYLICMSLHFPKAQTCSLLLIVVLLDLEFFYSNVKPSDKLLVHVSFLYIQFNKLHETYNSTNKVKCMFNFLRFSF